LERAPEGDARSGDRQHRPPTVTPMTPVLVSVEAFARASVPPLATCTVPALVVRVPASWIAEAGRSPGPMARVPPALLVMGDPQPADVAVGGP